MNHTGTIEIETERLILRRYTPSDAEMMFANWANDPEVTRYLIWEPHPNPASTRELLEVWEKEYDDPKTYNWCIELKSIHQPIGGISVTRLVEAVQAVEIGYCIGRAFWNQGILTEALNALIAFFFDQVGANRIAAHHDTRNPASGKVMLKSGMKFEGVARQAVLNNQGIYDAVQYAILKSDWQGK